MSLKAVSPIFNPISAVSYLSGSAFYDNSLVIDAAGEKGGMVFEIPKTGNINTIRVRLLTTTTGQQLTVGIYTVDASGNPTTTAYGGMVAGTVSVADTDDNLEKVVTLGTACAATEGDVVAVVVEFTSTAGNLQIARGGMLAMGFPYTLAYLAGAWGGRSANVPVVALGYDDGTYPHIYGVVPHTAGITSVAYNSGTVTFDEYGSLWTPDVPVRLKGLYIPAYAAAAGADAEWIAYDGTTALQTINVDGDFFRSTGVGNVARRFPTPITINAGESRRLAVRPTTANSVTLNYFGVGTTAALEAAMGGSFVGTRRLNQGAWDEASPYVATHPSSAWLTGIFPIFDMLDDGRSRSGRSRLIIGGTRV